MAWARVAAKGTSLLVSIDDVTSNRRIKINVNVHCLSSTVSHLPAFDHMTQRKCKWLQGLHGCNVGV